MNDAFGHDARDNPHASASRAEVGSDRARSLRSERAVHRAAAELKRGVPVLVRGEVAHVAVPAETVGHEGMTDFLTLTNGPAVLLLAASRAASVLGSSVNSALGVVALRVPDGLSRAALRGIADPTADQLLGSDPSLAELPAGAPAILALAKLARLLPAMLVAPVLPNAEFRAEAAEILQVTEADIQAHAAFAARQLVRVAETRVPLEDAPDARVVAFRAPDAGVEHLAILIGRPEIRQPGAPAPLVRVHSECFTGDLLGSLRCDCGPQLRRAIRRIAAEGHGAVLYLAQEGRGIGLVNKLRAYAMQDRGLDTLDANRALGWGADERDFLVAGTMLDLLRIPAIRLLTNNPAKLSALSAAGIAIEGRESHVVAPNGVDDAYLATKAARFGHYLG